MPNMKNAKKKVKVINRQNTENNTFKASMRTAIKNVEKAVASKDKTKAEDTLKIAIKRIDKAASKGLIHANKASRDKARLAAKLG